MINDTGERKISKGFSVATMIPTTREELVELNGQYNYSHRVNTWNNFEPSTLFSDKSDIDSQELAQLKQIADELDFVAMVSVAKESVQKIYPDIPLTDITVFFWVAGRKTNAKVNRKERFVGINLTNIFNANTKKDLIILESELISLLTHEFTHLLVDQLAEAGVIVKPSLPWQRLIWEEGLTTYMETVHMFYHDLFMKDINFWIEICQQWLTAADGEKKQKILEKALAHPLYNKTLQGIKIKIEERIAEQENLDTVFLALLSFSNGPGYHVGYVYWCDQVKSGRSLAEIITSPAGTFIDWLDSDFPS